jgi:hypothetical protein
MEFVLSPAAQTSWYVGTIPTDVPVGSDVNLNIS